VASAQDGLTTLKAGEAAPHQLVQGKVLVEQRELEALRDAAKRAVFRAEAAHMPPLPYEQRAMVYDGAVVAIEYEGPAFLSTCSWLLGAERIELLDAEQRVQLELERCDERNDLALLRASTPVEDLRPMTLSQSTPMLSYALLSPQTLYEQLATVSVRAERLSEATMWATSLAAINGYPMFSADLELIALHARRDGSEGLAIGWPLIASFLEAPEERAPARAPDWSASRP
jgi:hypothetical protein